MLRVFLSYSTHDLEWADYLRSLLAAAQVDVFVAERDALAGGSLSATISSQIQGCDLFVLLWSANAKASRYAEKELFLALAVKRNILPIAIQAGVPLPPELGDMKYLDVAKDPRAQIAWLKEHVAALARSKQKDTAVALAFVGFFAYAIFKN